MVIYNLNGKGIPVFPFKNNAPLIIDSDAILAFPISLKRLQPIPGRLLQVLKSMGIGDHSQFAAGGCLNLIR